MEMQKRRKLRWIQREYVEWLRKIKLIVVIYILLYGMKFMGVRMKEQIVGKIEIEFLER